MFIYICLKSEHLDASAGAYFFSPCISTLASWLLGGIGAVVLFRGYMRCDSHKGICTNIDNGKRKKRGNGLSLEKLNHIIRN